MSEPKTYQVLTGDGQSFSMSDAAARLSGTIQKLIEDIGDDPDQVIPMPNVDGPTMSHVLQYCDLYAGLQNAVTNFLTPLSIDTMFSMLHAANYLDIQSLLHSLSAHIATMMHGKTPQQLREMFHITNDFTPEEEAEILEENSWAFAPK